MTIEAKGVNFDDIAKRALIKCESLRGTPLEKINVMAQELSEAFMAIYLAGFNTMRKWSTDRPMSQPGKDEVKEATEAIVTSNRMLL